MKRWLHRLLTVFSAVARLGGVLLRAVTQTLRERRTAHRPDTRGRPYGGTPRPAGTPGHEIAVVVEGKAIHLPHPSIWPAVVGLGTAMMLFGIVTSLGYSVVGLLVLLLGLGGWIGELHEEAGDEEGGDGDG